MATTVEEFKGTDLLVYAEVTKDTDAEITFGTVKKLAPVAEIAKTTETNSETKFYDNKPALTINSEGADEINLTVSVIDLETLAEITGKTYDTNTGALFDGESTPKYFALGYRLGLSDGTYRYVWRYKGSFAIPEEGSQTKDGGTNSQNQKLKYTGISTTHIFSKTRSSQKAIVVDERDGKANLASFFTQVTTCDTIQKKSGH